MENGNEESFSSGLGAAELAAELIKKKEISDSLNFIENILKNLGFVCERIILQGVDNLYAYKNLHFNNNLTDFERKKDTKTLAFMGHVDVVPVGEEALWEVEPFAGSIVEEKVFGRGAVDMKGGLACFLSALEEILFLEDSNKKFPLVFLITGDEEGLAQFGTKAVLQKLEKEDRLPNIDFVLLGEPTSRNFIGDNLKIGGRGSLNVKVTMQGKAGHVAYFSSAVNPVTYMVKFLNDLKNKNFDDQTDIFEKTNLEITSIDVGNNANNVIPESVTAKFNIRFNDKQSVESLLKWLESTLNLYKKEILFSSEVVVGGRPFLSKDSELLKRLSNACKKITGKLPVISAHGANSDARFIENKWPFAELGLRVEQAHNTNEFASLKDLKNLTLIYKEFLKSFYKN